MSLEEAKKSESAGIDYYVAMDEIFQKAKERDEFEYICSLLRIRGMEDAGWDPLAESHAAINDYIALIQSPLRDIIKVRLALLTYCHITEVDALYDMLANMLRTIRGDRCSMVPFIDYTSAMKIKVRSPKQKIRALTSMERELGRDSLGHAFTSFFDDEIRNAFYHSDYTIYENEFRYRKRWSRQMRVPSALPVDEVMKKAQNGINFYLAFMRLYDDHRLRYKEPKILKGRIGSDGSWMDVEIIVRKGLGVTGFRSPPTTEG